MSDNRTNEPTPEQVEAAAKALAIREPMRSATAWENLHEFERSGFRESARAALVAAQGAAPAVSGSTSDGHHTFDELYEYRMLYNAHAAHGWLAAGIPVVKSWRHSDGEECFGGGWFIVTATLPSGQVSNHYKAEHWELFTVPEVDLPPEYDGHTPQVAAERLRAVQGAARPVNGFDTTAERVKTGADSLHVAPQEPNQNETKSGNNFVSLDAEKVAAFIETKVVGESPGVWASRVYARAEFVRALCEAYTEGKLT